MAAESAAMYGAEAVLRCVEAEPSDASEPDHISFPIIDHPIAGRQERPSSDE